MIAASDIITRAVSLARPDWYGDAPEALVQTAAYEALSDDLSAILSAGVGGPFAALSAVPAAAGVDGDTAWVNGLLWGYDTDTAAWVRWPEPIAPQDMIPLPYRFLALVAAFAARGLVERMGWPLSGMLAQRAAESRSKLLALFQRVPALDAGATALFSKNVWR